MVLVTRTKCDYCGKESDTAHDWLCVGRVLVYAITPPDLGSETVIDEPFDLDNVLTFCGQECFHKFLAARFAQYTDPHKCEQEEVVA